MAIAPPRESKSALNRLAILGRSMSTRLLVSIALMLSASYVQAVPVSSSDQIRIDFTPSFSPDGWFNGAQVSFTFDFSGNRLDTGEGWTVTAYNLADQPIGSRDFVAGPIVGGFPAISVGVPFSGMPKASDIGYLIYSNILGSFDLTAVDVELLYLVPSGNPNFPPIQGFMPSVPHTVRVFAVPEPDAALLLATGLLGLVARQARSKR